MVLSGKFCGNSTLLYKIISMFRNFIELSYMFSESEKVVPTIREIRALWESIRRTVTVSFLAVIMVVLVEVIFKLNLERTTKLIHLRIIRSTLLDWPSLAYS